MAGDIPHITQDAMLDPFAQLMAAARRYPLLTPGQEQELAKRIERGDLAAKECLINSNIRLVVSIAKRYQNNGLPFADLVSEGMLGLIRASEKFDWRRGYRFSTYSTLWIRQAIQRGLENTSRTIRLPVHVAQRTRRIEIAARALANDLGRDPTPDEIADRTKLDVGTVEQAAKAAETVVSLDGPVGSDEEYGTLGALVQSEEPSAEQVTWAEERDRTLRVALTALPERERTVLLARFGLGQDLETQRSIGRRLGVSISTVSALERRALKTLAQMPSVESLREAA